MHTISGARVTTPSQTVSKQDALRERSAHIVSRLQCVNNRLSSLRYNITGAAEALNSPQAAPAANPAPLPPISESTMHIMALIGEIEMILTDIEGEV